MVIFSTFIAMCVTHGTCISHFSVQKRMHALIEMEVQRLSSERVTLASFRPLHAMHVVYHLQFHV